jgi:broad specificity phosphatase PhoE
LAVAIFLIRHGESVGNVEQFFQGQRDCELTETGRAQAQALGRWLGAQGFQFEHVFASPLSRARVTAEILCEQLGRPGPELEPDIREYAAGVLEGLKPSEISERFPEYAQRGLGQRGDFSAYGGESYDDMQARLKRFILRMQDLPREADYAAVLHGGCLYQLLKLWCGWPTPRHFFIRLTNCCVLKLVVREVDHITTGELQWFLPLELATSLAPVKTYVEV